jgi:hypothetical protein
VNREANHPLIEMIFLTLCASISDADGGVDVDRYGNATLDWLRTFFPFKNGISSEDTLGRGFSRLDTVEFYAAMRSWTNKIAGCLRGKSEKNLGDSPWFFSARPSLTNVIERSVLIGSAGPSSERSRKKTTSRTVFIENSSRTV